MTPLEAIQRRHSVRAYKDIPLSERTIKALQENIDYCNTEGGLNIQLVTNEPKAFSGKLAHYGKFSGVNNYIAIVGRKSIDLDELGGYFGERLVIQAQMLGLNTCWVGLTYSKVPEAIAIGKDEKLVCLIALGYGATQGVSRKSKTVDQVCRTVSAPPKWFRRGVEAALLAPTAMNQQKFTFILNEGNKVQAKRGWGFFSKVDMGIVKYHFEIGAAPEKFEWV